MHAARRYQFQLVCTYHMNILSVFWHVVAESEVLANSALYMSQAMFTACRDASWACVLSAPLFAIARALCVTLDIDSRRNLQCCNRCRRAELQGCALSSCWMSSVLPSSFLPGPGHATFNPVSRFLGRPFWRPRCCNAPFVGQLSVLNCKNLAAGQAYHTRPFQQHDLQSLTLGSPEHLVMHPQAAADLSRIPSTCDSDSEVTFQTGVNY